MDYAIIEEDDDPKLASEFSTDEVTYKRHVLPPKGERSWKDIVAYPFLASKSYFTRVESVFGWRFLVYLGVSQCLLKGLTNSTTTSMMLPLFKTVLQVDAKQLQFYMMIVMLGWSVKPLLGLLSDLLLIGGYHKRFWLLQALVVGVTCSGFAFLAYAHRSPIGLTICMAGIQFQIALFDLMSESSYSAIMRDKPFTGSDVVTLVQGYQHVGSIASMLFVGFMADHSLFYPLFAIVATSCLMPLLPTLWGWLHEERFPYGTPEGNTTKGCGTWFMSAGPTKNRGMVAVIAFTGVAAPVTAIVANAGDPALGLSVALLMTIAALLGAFYLFPPLIARIALLQVLINLSRPALGSAMDYFYTADETCLIGGPHFSYAYYITYAGLVGSLSSFVAVIVYQAFLSGLKFRAVLVITTLLSGAVGASDLFIVTRTNIALGIPDQLAYIIGEATMEPMLNMLAYIPTTALLSKVLPKGMESSAFAFLAGIYNFSYMISEMSGALIFDAAGVKTVAPCDFSPLWWLIIVCHVSLPIVVGIPSAWLIPNVYQTDALTEQN